MAFQHEDVDSQMVFGGLAGKASPQSSFRNSRKLHEVGTPHSEPSTAPPTPGMSYALPSLHIELGDWDDDFRFCRTHSIVEEDDMFEDGPPATRLQGVFQDIKSRNLQEHRFVVLEMKLNEVKELYHRKYGTHVEDEDDLSGRCYAYDSDGMLWQGTVGIGVPADNRVVRLEQKLEEVKQLYQQKYGSYFEDDDVVPSPAVFKSDVFAYDSEGTLWTHVAGTRTLKDQRLEQLETKLDEVKKLYKQKYGEQVDSHEHYSYDSDGTLWHETAGTGTVEDQRIERLEAKLLEVKQLYYDCYGHDVDGDAISAQSVSQPLYSYDSDGTLWTWVVGSGLPVDARVERLEAMLEEVQELQLRKDSKHHYAYDVDGTLWKETFGTGDVEDSRFQKLEAKLDEVKCLYQQRYGHDVDDEGIPLMTCNRTMYSYDDDGMLWIQTYGTGTPIDQRTARLERQLAEVKRQYSLDGACYAYDSDGTLWEGNMGTGHIEDARLERLDTQLEEVKALYRQRYGKEVDDDQEDNKICNMQFYGYDNDGTLWIQTVGTGIPVDQRVLKLEQILLEVKHLSASKPEVLTPSHEHYAYDTDGTLWRETQATRSLQDERLERLNIRLEEVKELYAKKYGRDVDSDEAVVDACQRPLYAYDDDGLLWMRTPGTGKPTDQRVQKLELKLNEVKQLYRQKYGEDVFGTEHYAYDRGGTLWQEISSTGIPEDQRINRLESKLEEVKTLYREKYGHEFDDLANDVSVGPLYAYDADGTLWVQTVGTGTPCDQRLERLGVKLAAVKELYEHNTGISVDDDDNNAILDADGTSWVYVAGTKAPVDQRILKLEASLEQAKDLFEKKYGYSVDDADEIHSLVDGFEYHRDNDGMLWKGCTGAVGITASTTAATAAGAVAITVTASTTAAGESAAGNIAHHSAPSAASGTRVNVTTLARPTNRFMECCSTM
jgi:tetrahydromethanopterin S-methyltransferase subunit G